MWDPPKEAGRQYLYQAPLVPGSKNKQREKGIMIKKKTSIGGGVCPFILILAILLVKYDLLMESAEQRQHFQTIFSVHWAARTR